MTNDNNNINKLVADDDDATVSLEILNFGRDYNATEAELKTYDAEKAVTRDSSSGVSISKLQSDLRSRKKTISQLQYDIQQLHTKWRGLETEIGARESQTEQLNDELSSLRAAHARQEKLLKKRERKIQALLAELAEQSEQVESIDERISKRSPRIDQNKRRAPSNKITRVLIGTVDGQVLRFPLFKDRLTIGRTKNNDIQLKAGYVSRRHAVIQTDGATTRIIDWGSKNGIHVNSTKVSEHFLRSGDTVIIGNARFRYVERKKRNS